MNYFKPISISLSPNVEKDDLHLALNLIIRPWLWKKGKTLQELEGAFKKYLGVKYVFSFNSGRSAFLAILKSLNLEPNSEVLVQAFTCNASPNPILWAGLRPIYVDCNLDDFNIDVKDLEAKITTRTKAVVVQHTFGLPANMDAVRTLCASYNLLLIEDCAHSLGAEFKEIKVGSHSKASFFSFSRDKIISSVYGGIAATNDEDIAENLTKYQLEFGPPNNFWTFQQILHPIILGYIVLPIYKFLDLGKILLVFSQLFHILSKAVSREEKRGAKPNYFPKAMTNALAVMALNQFYKLQKFNDHRQKIANYYYEQLKDTRLELPKKFINRKNVFLRFTVKHKNAHDLIYEAWHNQNILLGDWYTAPVAPFDTKMEELKYTKGSCQNAEYLSKHTLNLPTHINISIKDAERIVKFLKKYLINNSHKR